VGRFGKSFLDFFQIADVQAIATSIGAIAMLGQPLHSCRIAALWDLRFGTDSLYLVWPAFSRTNRS
jgi:hypothetical protein